MRGTLSLLAAGLLFPATMAQAQDSSLARQVFSSDSIFVTRGTVSPDERWVVFIRTVSNQESRVMIQPLAGGEPRDLLAAAGSHYYNHPQFTPQGDRIVMVSTQPRRSPTDNLNYLISAPFDTRTGTLAGPPRQISLDGVSGGPQRLAPAISPDGRWVAYAECCTSHALKVIPMNGGNAHTLVSPGSHPNSLAWTPDGRFVFYELPGSQGYVRLRISRDGGVPSVVARSSERLGALMPDNRYSFVVERRPGAGPSRLLLFDGDGRPLGEVAVPRVSPFFSTFGAKGKYIVGITGNAVAPLKIVPVAGGPIRQITPGDDYDWPAGWSDDGEEVYVETTDQGHKAVAIVSRNGGTKRTIRLPEDPPNADFLGIRDGYLVYQSGGSRGRSNWRIFAMSLKDGSRKELARDVVAGVCCALASAGSMGYGTAGKEFFFRQLSGNRLRLRAITTGGESRQIGEVPASLLGRTGFAVFENRVVYKEPVKDSVRLQLLTGPGRPPKTLATFSKTIELGEFVWSRDGRRLALSVGDSPPKLLIYHFDAGGALKGAPLTLMPPFEYWYEIVWLPDGSGLTMIAQPRGAGFTEVALVRLADPEHPILLTREDRVSKWGHALSPDGKYVAYPSEQLKGSSIYLIEVAELLKRVQAPK